MTPDKRTTARARARLRSNRCARAIEHLHYHQGRQRPPRVHRQCAPARLPRIPLRDLGGGHAASEKGAIEPSAALAAATATTVVAAMADADSVTAKSRQVFDLYRKFGDEDYLGEAVSKTAHSIQAAMLAERDGRSREVILAAFLHDVGHLVGVVNRVGAMVTDGVNLGAQDHDKVGADFLRQLGVPEAVCALVARHVDAKRYLVCTNPDYRQNLSEASRLTLVHQGGAMTRAEAALFEKDAEFELSLVLRRYDELAKDPDARLEPLEKYERLFADYMSEIGADE